jgi:hypothetical protein
MTSVVLEDKLQSSAPLGCRTFAAPTPTPCGLWGWGFFVLFFSQFFYVASLMIIPETKKKKKH